MFATCTCVYSTHQMQGIKQTRFTCGAYTFGSTCTRISHPGHMRLGLCVHTFHTRAAHVWVFMHVHLAGILVSCTHTFWVSAHTEHSSRVNTEARDIRYKVYSKRISHVELTHLGPRLHAFWVSAHAERLSRVNTCSCAVM